MDASSCVMGVSGLFPVGVHRPLFGLIMVLTLLVRKKNYARILKSGTPSTSPWNLPTNTLSGGSICPVLHTKLASGRGWYVVLNEYFTPSSVLVLNTSFCLVEHAPNARPLTPVSADPSDLGAITPNHFLLGNQATAIPSIVGVDEFDHRKRYARSQSYANAIWSRWINVRAGAEPTFQVADACRATLKNW